MWQTLNPVGKVFEDKQFEALWLELQRRLAAGLAGAGGGLSTCLYVDPAGDDATAKRGSLSLKFKTIQAAVTASSTGDLVVVAPGVFPESVVAAPNKSLNIIGAGDCTSIEPPAGNAISYNPDGDYGLMIAGLRVNAGDIAIAPTVGSLGKDRPWVVSDVLLDNDASLRVTRACSGLINTVRSRQGNNGVLLERCTEPIIHDCRLIRCEVNWDDTLPPPDVIAGYLAYMLGGRVYNVSVTKQGALQMVGVLIENQTSVSPTQASPGGSPIARLFAAGSQLGNLVVQANISDAAVASRQVVQIDGCRFSQISANNAGAGPTVPLIVARNSALDPGGVGVSGGNGMELDLRGCTLPSALVSGGSSTFWLSEYDVTDALGPQVVNGPTNIGLPINFKDPTKMQVMLQPAVLDSVVNVLATLANQINLDGMIAGAPGAIPTRIVITQSG